MPRSNAAEAMPMSEPQDQEEKEIQEALRTLKEEPPPIPKGEEATNDTKAALEDLRRISIARDLDAAAEERRKILGERHKAATERSRRNMGADALAELPGEYVKQEPPPIPGEEARAEARELADLRPMAKEAKNDMEIRAAIRTMREEPPPIPADAKKAKAPEAKKPWYKRLFGSKE